MAKPKTTINPNDIKTRDPLILKLLTGATKAGVEEDRKKRQNKRKCRTKVRPDED